MKAVTVYIDDDKSADKVHVVTDCGDGIIFCKDEIQQGINSTKQQPTVPVQFVMVETVLYPADEFNAITSAIENCTVEQIGAVLYVRGE